MAAHFVADENNQQTEVLTAVVDGWRTENWPNFALRLALTTHASIPRENEIDALAEAEQDFAPPEAREISGEKEGGHQEGR